MTAVSLAGSMFYVLMGLGPEASQGLVQKIFFFHVPAAFSMYLTMLSGTIFSILYLREKKPSYDQAARASMYVALFFSCIVLVSGPIWAKPIWGVYWTWDPRLTTSFVVFILLLAYAFVRLLFEERESLSNRGALVGAILSIFALADAPLIHLSVKLWRGVHPSVLRNPEGLPDDYRTALELMSLSFFLLAGLLSLLMYKILKIQDAHKSHLQKILMKSKGNTHA